MRARAQEGRTHALEKVERTPIRADWGGGSQRAARVEAGVRTGRNCGGGGQCGGAAEQARLT